MYVKINYPSPEIEHAILLLARQEASSHLPNKTNPQKNQTAETHLTQSTLFAARNAVLNVHTSEALTQYLVDLVVATRHPKPYSETLARWLRFGASPRATIALDRCAKAHAWLAGRDYVTPEDIHTIAPDVLRHRILLTYEAEAEGMDSDAFLSELLRLVALP